MAAECEVDDCGVLAVGRCIQCGRAFCASHRAMRDVSFFGDRAIPNQCALCKANENAARIAADPQAQATPIVSRARITLAELGVPKQEIVWTRHESQRIRRGFSSRTELVEVVERKDEAWLIGPVSWTIDAGGETYRRVTKTFETAVLDEDSVFVGKNFVRLHCGEHGWHAMRTGSGGVEFIDAARAISEIEQRYQSS